MIQSKERKGREGRRADFGLPFANPPQKTLTPRKRSEARCSPLANSHVTGDFGGGPSFCI
jgi:hypothetical protein